MLHPNHFAQALYQPLAVIDVVFAEVGMWAERQTEAMHHTDEVWIVFIELGMERLYKGVLTQVVGQFGGIWQCAIRLISPLW